MTAAASTPSTGNERTSSAPSRVVNREAGDGWTVELLVEADNLRADLRYTRGAQAPAGSLDDVLAMVRQSGLVLSEADEAQLTSRIAALLRTHGGTQTIATGVAPAAAAPKFEWKVPVVSDGRHADDGSNHLDLHEVTRFVKVKSGDLLGEATEIPAVVGRDVFGKPVPPPVAEAPLVVAVPAEIKLGEGVGLDGDDRKLVAKRDGCVRLDDGKISVLRVFEVRGDVDFKVGNIDFDGQVIVQGSVLPDFKIRATEDVVVKGMVESAFIDAGKDLLISGGVVGRHKGKLSAKGKVKARFLEMCTVDADGDVEIDSECLDAHVTTGGSFTVKKGRLIGGVVHAAGAVHVPVLGSEVCVPTAVAAGFRKGAGDPIEALHRTQATERERQRLIEQALGPFLAHPDRAPGSRRAEVDRLHTLLTDSKSRLAVAQAELEKLSADANHAVVLVDKTLYPNVVVQIGSLCKRKMEMESSGPLRLVADPANASVEIHGTKVTPRQADVSPAKGGAPPLKPGVAAPTRGAPSSKPGSATGAPGAAGPAAGDKKMAAAPAGAGTGGQKR